MKKITEVFPIGDCSNAVEKFFVENFEVPGGNFKQLPCLATFYVHRDISKFFQEMNDINFDKQAIVEFKLIKWNGRTGEMVAYQPNIKFCVVLIPAYFMDPDNNKKYFFGINEKNMLVYASLNSSADSGWEVAVLPTIMRAFIKQNQEKLIVNQEALQQFGRRGINKTLFGTNIPELFGKPIYVATLVMEDENRQQVFLTEQELTRLVNEYQIYVTTDPNIKFPSIRKIKKENNNEF